MKNERNVTALSASSIAGTTVLNPAMETIGSIEDLMVDLDTGDVNYAVLSVDTGFLNMGSKYFAIPLEEFDFKPTSKEAMLNIDKERLENSPGFDKDNWPTGAQHDFVNEVFSYYGRERSNRSTHSDEHTRNAGRASTVDTAFRERGGYMDKGSATDRTGRASTDPNKNIL